MTHEIDWSKAPDGATHGTEKPQQFIRIPSAWGRPFDYWTGEKWQPTNRMGLPKGLIPRPTSTAIPVSQNQTLEAELSALRTAAIADAAEIERLWAENERLKVGNDRYEILRKLNVVKFQALYTKALQSHLPFDELVDELGVQS